MKELENVTQLDMVKKYPIDGKLYSSCDGKSLEAGEDIQCRCWDTFVINLEDGE